MTARDEELRESNRRLEADARLSGLETKVRDLMAAERKSSNELYAIKLTERIVFGLVTILLLATVGAIVAQVLK